MQQTEKYWDLINRIVRVAVAIMALVGLVLAFTPKIKQIRTYQQTLKDKQQTLEQKIAAGNQLQENQRRFLTDPDFVERVAHEVGYARKDEVIFHFPEETGAE